MRYRIMYIISLFLLIVGITTCVVYAWFILEDGRSGTIQDAYIVKSNMKYYLATGTELNTDYPAVDYEFYRPTTGTYNLNNPLTVAQATTLGVYDPVRRVFKLDGNNTSAINFVGKFIAVLEINVQEVSRIRFNAQAEWAVTRNFTDPNIPDETKIMSPDLLLPDPLNPGLEVKIPSFNFDSNLVRTNPGDAHYYYQVLLNKNVDYNITMCFGGRQIKVSNLAGHHTETSLIALDFKVDWVQANRYSEVWHVPKNVFI